MNDVMIEVLSTFLPYVSPIIFVLGAIAVSDRLREMLVNSFTQSAGDKKRRVDF